MGVGLEVGGKVGGLERGGEGAVAGDAIAVGALIVEVDLDGGEAEAHGLLLLAEDFHVVDEEG